MTHAGPAHECSTRPDGRACWPAQFDHQQIKAQPAAFSALPLPGLVLPAATGADRPNIVRRGRESAALLSELATPQVFAGPNVLAQNWIIAELESQIDRNPAYDQPLLVLGGIELGRIPDTAEDDATMSTGPPSSTCRNIRWRVRQMRSHLVESAGVGKAVVMNTLTTMITARQIEYLRKSRLGDDTWKIVVEMHYYRRRNKSQLALHKDTLGQTLFVNLSFATAEPIIGPEYLVNRRRVRYHDRRTATWLPDQFREDLQQTRSGLGDPVKIMAPIVPANGVVAFVDEAVHHSTPHYGHRTVTGAAFYVKP